MSLKVVYNSYSELCGSYSYGQKLLELPDEVIERIDELFDGQEIEAYGNSNPDNLYVNGLYEVDSQEALIDKNEVLTFIELNSDDLSVLLEFNFYECGLFPEVTNDFELGQYMIKENGFNMAYFLKYFDYEKYGRDVRLLQGGSFVDKGYFVSR